MNLQNNKKWSRNQTQYKSEDKMTKSGKMWYRDPIKPFLLKCYKLLENIAGMCKDQEDLEREKLKAEKRGGRRKAKSEEKRSQNQQKDDIKLKET